MEFQRHLRRIRSERDPGWKSKISSRNDKKITRFLMKMTIKIKRISNDNDSRPVDEEFWAYLGPGRLSWAYLGP